MASFQETLQSITEARKLNANASSELYTNRIKILKENIGLSSAEISSKLNDQLSAEHAGREALQEKLNQLYAADAPQTLINNLDSNVPVLLMPLRLETTFKESNGKKELWLRIYPDDIAVQQHELLLTEKEFEEGKLYWQLFFEVEKNALESDNLKKTVWEKLISIFGPNRSAWVTKETFPVNWNSRSTLTKKEELQFPEPHLLKPEEWTQAPITRVLPEKFVVSIFKGDTKVHEQTGNLIPDILFLGQDPFQGGEAFTKTESGIEFGKDFSWIADFEQAVTVGMAMKIELKNELYIDIDKQLIDKIIVLGINLSTDAAESANSLNDLFESHRYTEGLALVPQGTPTNNTEDSSAGFIPNQDPQPKGYFEIPDVPAFQNDPLCDGSRLVTALGIEVSVIEGIANDLCRDHAEAVNMNGALFPATIGYYFDTLMDNYVPDKYIPMLSNFFENYVTGSGPLPAIRVGDQPYGIVVTSDFTNWKSGDTDPDQQLLTNQIHKTLSFFSSHWAAQSEKVLYVGRENDSQGNLLNSDDVFFKCSRTGTIVYQL